MLLAKSEITAAAKGKTAEPSAPRDISQLEAEVISMFVQLARAIGLPRSYAEIYGLIFISPRPLELEDIIARLGMSSGSVRTRLKYLRDLGAIKLVYLPGNRGIHYEAVAQLRLLVTRFLQEQVLPQFDSGRERLDAITDLVQALPPAERAHVAQRIDTLRTWATRTERVMPLLMKIIEP